MTTKTMHPATIDRCKIDGRPVNVLVRHADISVLHWPACANLHPERYTIRRGNAQIHFTPAEWEIITKF